MTEEIYTQYLLWCTTASSQIQMQVNNDITSIYLATHIFSKSYIMYFYFLYKKLYCGAHFKYVGLVIEIKFEIKRNIN